jgi:phosphoglycolate phosphatase
MRLIVFDFDGTIIDSRRDLIDSTNEVLESYGAPAQPADAVAAMIGDGAKKLVERALAAAGLDPLEPEALPRFRRIYDRRLLDSTRPYEGMADLLASASRRAPLALLSNKPEAPTRRLLSAFGLARHFSWVIGGDSGFERKPDPAGLDYLMTVGGATRASTLFVGDSAVDAETARRAGVQFCLVDFGFGKLPATLELESDAVPALCAADISVAINRFLES